MPFSTSVFVRNGRFVDLTPLKSGAFGAVYRALDTQLSRRVAVKATIPGNRPFDVLQREFSKEARLQASFSHPNIVTTHELLEDSGELYLVCEYADHGSLGDLLEKGSTLDEQQVISVGLDICAALRAITRRGIIHRDVKPSNILLYNDPTRSFPVAKLGDFGVALEQGMTRPEQLRPLPHPGSPLYMPPEQLSEDDKPLTSAVDIFALGACLWEMFTGEHYKLKKKLPGHYPNVRDLAPNASEGIAKVIEWAVQEDPTLRYQTPEDLEADLRRVRDGKRPIGPVLPAARFPRFLRSMLFGVAVFLVAGTGYIGIRAFNDQGGPSQAPTVAGIAAGIADAPSNTPASAPTVTSVASSTAEATATFTPEPPTSTPEPPTDTPTNTPTHTPPPTNTSMPPTNTPKLPTKTPEPPPTAPPITPPTDTPIPPTNTPAPEPPPTSILDVLFEDFESTMRMKWWSPDPHVFSYILTSEQGHGGNQSLRIEYRKSDTYQFIGAEPPSDLRDFSQTKILQVWVYGQVNLLLKLEDEDGQQADVAILSATDPSGWNLLRFKYTGVASRVNLTRIKSLFFFPAPGDPSASGVVYLDDIALSKQP